MFEATCYNWIDPWPWNVLKDYSHKNVTIDGYKYETAIPGKKWTRSYQAAGVYKGGLKVTLKEQILTIAYSPPKQQEKDKRDPFISYSPWEFSLAVDKNVLAEDITAQYENGILRLSCEVPEQREVDVNCSIPVK